MDIIINKIIETIKEKDKEIEFFNYKKYDDKGLYIEIYIKNKGE